MSLTSRGQIVNKSTYNVAQEVGQDSLHNGPLKTRGTITNTEWHSEPCKKGIGCAYSRQNHTGHFHGYLPEPGEQVRFTVNHKLGYFHQDVPQMR